MFHTINSSNNEDEFLKFNGPFRIMESDRSYFETDKLHETIISSPIIYNEENAIISKEDQDQESE